MTVTKDESGQEGSDDKGDMPAGAPAGADGYTPSERRLERERYKRARARRATAIVDRHFARHRLRNDVEMPRRKRRRQVHRGRLIVRANRAAARPSRVRGNV